MDVDAWIEYFSQSILTAQEHTLSLIEFVIQKTKFFDQHQKDLNVRQTEALQRMFREGPVGFKGGLSAEKYIAITKTSRATATRDLAQLVVLGALSKTGTGKGTRYYLRLAGSSKNCPALGQG